MNEKELTDIRVDFERQKQDQSVVEDRIEAAEYFAENEVNKDVQTQRFVMAARMLTTLDSDDKKKEFLPWLAKITMNNTNTNAISHCNGVLVNARN